MWRYLVLYSSADTRTIMKPRHNSCKGNDTYAPTTAKLTVVTQYSAEMKHPIDGEQDSGASACGSASAAHNGDPCSPLEALDPNLLHLVMALLPDIDIGRMKFTSRALQWMPRRITLERAGDAPRFCFIFR